MNLFHGTIQSLENTLNYATAKQQAISTNISNVDTPNYRAKDVVFKNVLNDALSNTVEGKKTNANHLSFGNDISSSYQMITRQQTTFNHNGNNVDVNKEMADLAKNQIYYQALVDRINGKFNNLQTVIRGGS